MVGGTVIPDTDAILDGVRTLLLKVWKAVNLKGSIPRSDLEDCFLSFGLTDPVCELSKNQPNIGIIIHGLENIESSLMGVTLS